MTGLEGDEIDSIEILWWWWWVFSSLYSNHDWVFVDALSCISAIAPVHCCSALWRARIKPLVQGFAGVDVLFGWNTLGEAMMTLGRYMLALNCSLLLVRASRNQRLLGFSGRTGVSARGRKLLDVFTVSLRTFSRLESKVLFKWQSCSKDSYPEDKLRRGVNGDGGAPIDLFLLELDFGDHCRGVQPKEGSTASHNFLQEIENFSRQYYQDRKIVTCLTHR